MDHEAAPLYLTDKIPHTDQTVSAFVSRFLVAQLAQQCRRSSKRTSTTTSEADADARLDPGDWDAPIRISDELSAEYHLQEQASQAVRRC
jgi:hypothetical protein